MQKQLYCILLIFCCISNLHFPQSISRNKTADLTLSLNLTAGQSAYIFVPTSFVDIATIPPSIIVHLHGDHTITEKAISDLHLNVVLITVNLGKFSGFYDKKYFYTPSKFTDLLGWAIKYLNDNNISKFSNFGKIILSGFSAGYAGIRSILNNEANYRKVSGIILADGMYCDNDADSIKLQLYSFTKIAQEAKASKKVFILTHSDVLTSEYLTAKPSADILLNSIELKRATVDLKDEIGTIESIANAGLLRVYGYKTIVHPSHYNHLFNISKLYKECFELLADLVR